MKKIWHLLFSLFFINIGFAQKAIFIIADGIPADVLKIQIYRALLKLKMRVVILGRM